MKTLRRLTFSLIEVLIATGIASILIGVIFFGFTNILRTKRKIESTTLIVLQRKLLQERLTQIFCSISKDNPRFTYKNEKIAFVFHHGVDHDPVFSGAVQAALYLEHGSLYLELASLKDEKAKRTERLMDHVANIKWTCIYPDRDNKEGVPIAIRLDLTDDDEVTIPMAFFPATPLKPLVVRS